MNKGLPDVCERIILFTPSKDVGHSAVVRNANEVAALGIFGHEAKATFFSDRKLSVMRRKTSGME
jgi:hypothetical protein